MAAAAETGFKGSTPWSGAAGQWVWARTTLTGYIGDVMLSRSIPGEASLGTHGGHTLAGLVAFPLLPTGIAIAGDGATFAPHDRVPLATSSAFDAPFFDRHSLPFRVTLVLAKTSVTHNGSS